MTTSSPTVSIAMCTFQGARFLPEQLGSLLAQTRAPDEVVVCDDGSTDDTMDQLNDFRERAPFPVHVHRTVARLGARLNFTEAMQRCLGDVIMLCDQDDIWYPTKVERLLASFREATTPALVFSDADLIDEQSRPKGMGLWEGLGFAPSLQAKFRRGDTIEVLSAVNVVCGATTAFDRRYLELALPIPEGWLHDAWLGLVTACVGEARMIDEPLIRYRLHPSQQIGIPTAMTRLDHLRRRSQLIRRMTKSERAGLVEQYDGYRLALVRVDEHRDEFPPRPVAVSYLEGKARHFELRASMPTVRSFRKRAALVAQEAKARRYHEFSNGWVSVAKDLLLSEKLGRRHR